MADLYDVYDFFYPSPVSLKDLASMEVALNLWRREILHHVNENGTLRERYPLTKTSLSRYLITDLRVPPTILPLIERYVVNLQSSIPNWLCYHFKEEIVRSDVLKHFLDFVCDFDGSIDHGKTAKRFVVCSGISDDVKFKMACYYCLEEQVLRIWPEVSSRMNKNEIDYCVQPMLYFWVCRLKNETPDVHFDTTTSCIEELALQVLYENAAYDIAVWPAIEFFLNRLPSDIRSVHMCNLYSPISHGGFETLFLRFVLAKLNAAELKKVVNSNGAHFITNSWPPYVLRIWEYIKNEMTIVGFCRLVVCILKEQADNPSPIDCTPYFRDLWTTAPDTLKQVVIREVLPIIDTDSTIFDRFYAFKTGDRRSVSFLSAILSDTPIENRKTFWNKNWESLIHDIRPDDLRVLIDLCFDNDETRISEFKKDVMSEYHQKIHTHAENFYVDGCFEELEEFFTIWCPQEQTIKEIRLELLLDDFCVSPSYISSANLLNELIDNAFGDRDLATEFKKKLFAIPEMNAIESLKYCILHFGDLRYIREFIDAFALSDETATEIKKRDIVPTLESAFNDTRFFHNYLEDNFDEFEKFIGWLFKSSDEIVRFKEALDMDSIIQELIRNRTKIVEESKSDEVDYDWYDNCFQTSAMPDSVVKKFLKWYFVTPQAVENFEKKYAHDPMFNRFLL